MKTRLGKIRALSVTTALTAILSGALYAQDPAPGPYTLPAPPAKSKAKPPIASPVKVKVKPSFKTPAPWTIAAAPRKDEAPPEMYSGGETYEKSIAVDPKSKLSLCVSQGNVKINGWSRNEIRVFVKEGSKLGFTVQEKNPKSGLPAWIKVAGYEPGKPGVAKECIWGEQIEIDAPRTAAVGIEGKETNTKIDSIRSAFVRNAGGNISISNVTEGVNALTLEGDLDIENSDGQIVLTTTTGNIVGFELSPGQVGDTFRAKTSSGNISLQGLEHRQVDVNSVSGSVMFNGALLDGGIYNIGTSNGTLSLSVPQNSPCFLIATFVEGNFNSDVPFKLSTENVSPGPVKTIKGTLGQGDCKLNLTSASGLIRLRKLPTKP